MSTQTPPQDPAAALWRRITPRPAELSFITGSTGSGKSTLGGGLLGAYRSYHPAHRIFIVDPKRRFFPMDSRPGMPLFPHGVHPTNHGKRNGVTVTARLLRDVDGYKYRDERVFLIQDLAKAVECMEYQFTHSDVRSPVLFYIDESQDFIRGFQPIEPLKRAIQQGREVGMGVVLLFQLSRWIPTQFLSEAKRIYIGHLHHVKDRKALAQTVALPDPDRLLDGVPMHHFWMVDQVRPGNSLVFTLKEGSS